MKTSLHRLKLMLAAVCSTVLALPSHGKADEMESSLRDLLAKYRCPVVERLQRIYDFVNPKSDHDRFLVLELPAQKHAYVQCIFGNNKSILLCEASSGAHYGRDGVRMPFRQPAETESALAKLGFDVTVTDRNYRKETQIGRQRPEFNALADFMLKALHDGYGARVDSTLKANAPLAKPPYNGCIPIS